MFQFEKIENFGIEILKFQHSKTGVFAEFWPSLGGIVNKLGSHNQSIIVANSSPENFLKEIESTGFRNCKLSPFAGRLNAGKFVFEKENYQVDGFYLGENALHGFLYNRRFEIKNLKVDKDEVELILEHQYLGDNNGFPFSFRCSLIYYLKSSGSLRLKTEIENLSEKSFPIMDGWHPYFSFDEKVDDCFLIFDAKKMVETIDMIPTGKLIDEMKISGKEKIGDRKIDDCFLLDENGAKEIKLMDGNEKSIQIKSIENYDWVQIYIPDDRKSIAIEMQSAIPDSFNNGVGLKVLSPNEKISFIAEYSWNGF